MSDAGIVTLRMSTRMRALVDVASEARGESVSAFLRRAALEAAVHDLVAAPDDEVVPA